MRPPARRLLFCGIVAALTAGALGLVVTGLLLGPLIPSSVEAERFGAQAMLWALWAVAVLGVGAVVVWHRPRHPVGWLLFVQGVLWAVSISAMGYAASALPESPAMLPAGPLLLWVSNVVGDVAFYLVGLLFLLFPTGRLPSPRWRPVAWLAAVDCVALLVAYRLAPGPIDESFPVPVANPLGIEAAGATLRTVHHAALAAMLLVGLATVASLIVRGRRASGDERAQLKWLLYSAGLLVVSVVVLNGIRAAGSPAPWLTIGGYLFFAAAVTVPLAVGVAILKYRLYDIDHLINRTLVYGALTAAVIGLYVGVVGYLGALVRNDDHLAISLLATGVVAVLFQPLRERLQRGVNRLLYGERDDPYAVLSRLGRQLEATVAPEAVLPAVVHTVTAALRLPYAAIALDQDTHLTLVAEAGSLTGDLLRLPLTYQGEAVGELAVASRSPGEAFGPADRRLLDDLARQAGVAAHAVRLTADLRRARERLVTAREEERRRLRRDLHDGLGPQLASRALTLAAARKLIPRDPVAADALLADLARQAQTAVTDIRRLVHDLRPPALDDLGLLGALRESAARCEPAGLRVAVEAPAPELLPPLPAAVEVAAYRIAQEALTNVARHAAARSCTVRLDVDRAAGVLVVEVLDDGRGLPVDRRAGVGLASMRERAEELGGSCTAGPRPGGGTRVRALLPLPSETW